LNSVLAKTVSEYQKNWDVRLPFAMPAYRSTKHETTGYTLNHLVFERKVRVLVVIVLENPSEKLPEDYDIFVENMRERSDAAFAKVRSTCSEAFYATRNIMT